MSVCVCVRVRGRKRVRVRVRVSVCLSVCVCVCRDEFTVKILHSSFCDPKIELRSSWCDLCSSFFLVCFGEKIMLNSVTLSQLNQSRELNILKKKR